MDRNLKVKEYEPLATDPRLRRHDLGFLELADKPSQEELLNYYQNKYYQNESGNYRKTYSELEHAVISLRIAQRARQITLFRGEAPGTLLDVGCGEGFVLRHFANLGWSVSGLDFSKAGVEIMNPECASYVSQGDVFDLLNKKIQANQNYDLVWLGNVLEHVLDPIALLHSLRKLVNSSGLLLITVPNDGNQYHEYLYQNEKIPERWWVAIPDHISYFTADSLKHSVEKCGWDCLAIHGDFPIDWFLANEEANFLTNKSRGSAAHEARLSLEYLIGKAGLDKANRFYECLADVGLGRNITAYVRPTS